MPSSYSSRLRLELMATGEKSNTWGSVTNTNLGTLLEESIAGHVSIAHPDTASYTLTTTNGASDEARHMILEITGALTAARNVVVPNQEKLYVVKNSTTGGFSVVVKTGAGSGVTIANGASKLVFCNGTNVYEAITEFTGGYANITSTAAGPALTVTHDGSGDAVVINDSNPDTTPFVIDTSGRVISGHTAALTTTKGPGGASATPSIQQVGLTNATASYGAIGFGPAVYGNMVLAGSRGTSVGDYTVVQSGVVVGAITAEGSDGDEFIRSAQILFEIDGTPGASDMPGRIVLLTTPDGSANPTEAMRITKDGDVGIGRSSPVYNLDVLSQLRVSQGAYDNDLTGTDTAQSGLTVWGGNSAVTGSIRMGTQVESAAPATLDFYKSRGGAVSNTKLRAESGDALGRLSFSGLDRNQASSGAWVEGARIDSIVEAAPSAGSMPSGIRVFTMPSGGSLTEAVRITSDQDVGIGTDAPARRLEVLDESAGQNTILTVARFSRRSTGGVGQAGIGSAIEFAFENGSSVLTQGSQIVCESTNVTNGAEDADLVVRLMKDGTIGSSTEAMRLVGNTLAASFAGAGSFSGSLTATGNIQTSGGLIGYATGAGDAQTQTGSNTNAVTMASGKSCGIITMNTTVPGSTQQVFTVNCDTVTVNDCVIVNLQNNFPNVDVKAYNISSGSFRIAVNNTAVGATSAAPVINFSVVNVVQS